ncbi:ferredoxin II, 4Fe-4S bacterial type [Candidatus Palibaumannia cicadellinicola]|uniref:Ferredoxin II, 4Fe-4S bacterial type n=1 Tax=Candidatus Palibaumannia cicadellinicola TaxID=186490 RepID=A0A088NA07_9GAMM|nr:ferredoxin II, 4Fe-4S bacterial type [Candidatus Baumannia cicadellinicola]
MNQHQELIDKNKKQVAWINEADCIGCTKCMKVCPVYAIIGTRHAIHTVVRDLCTGCARCIQPCPTDCVVMRSVKVINIK